MNGPWENQIRAFRARRGSLPHSTLKPAPAKSRTAAPMSSTLQTTWLHLNTTFVRSEAADERLADSRDQLVDGRSLHRRRLEGQPVHAQIGIPQGGVGVDRGRRGDGDLELVEVSRPAAAVRGLG